MARRLAPPPPPPPRKTRWDRIAGTILLPLVLIGTLAAAFHPGLRITEVVPLGSDLAESELEEQFHLSRLEGQYLWQLGAARREILEAIAAHPRFETAAIRFSWPSRLAIDLVEKQRYAALLWEGEAYWIAWDYTFWGKEPAHDLSASRVITGLDPAVLFDREGVPLANPFPQWPPQPEAGDATRYYYSRILQLWSWIEVESQPPMGQVASIHLDPERGLILNYRTGTGRPHPPILLGYGPDLEKKYGQALTLWRSKKYWDLPDAEIDLRFDRNVVRTLASAPLPAPSTP